ncbi:MAG TPA: DUF2892 domain-containing protein [Ktedonobacteraceae bacterium]|jgi:hypothetical protein|nr:DUF2892 domain-containing protein [Ktedonobacteraceae bacterium]
MGSFVSFMQSLAGRLLRIVAGIALIAIGLLVIHNGWGIVVAVIGAVPLVAGLAGICLFASLFRYTLTGQRRVSPVEQIKELMNSNHFSW